MTTSGHHHIPSPTAWVGDENGLEDIAPDLFGTSCPIHCFSSYYTDLMVSTGFTELIKGMLDVNDKMREWLNWLVMLIRLIHGFLVFDCSLLNDIFIHLDLLNELNILLSSPFLCLRNA